jgi:hypothetical protein
MENEVKISEKRYIQLLGYEKEFIKLGLGAASRDELSRYIDSLELKIKELTKQLENNN